MTERICATCAKYNGGVCTVDGFIMGSYDAAIKRMDERNGDRGRL